MLLIDLVESHPFCKITNVYKMVMSVYVFALIFKRSLFCGTSGYVLKLFGMPRYRSFLQCFHK